MPELPRWSVQAALGMMDRFHIEAAILSVSSPGVHFGDNAAARALARSVNEEGAKASQRPPRALRSFASLPLPDVDDALEELAYALDVLKADGVVLETNYQRRYLGDIACIRSLRGNWTDAERQSVSFIRPRPTVPAVRICRSAIRVR